MLPHRRAGLTLLRVNATHPIPPATPANDVAPLPRPTPRQVLGLVGAKNLERAAGLARWGAIYDARVQGRELRARCEGTHGEAWRVAVRFGDDGAMEARCTCPAAEAGPCKHAGALVLAWRDRPGDFAVSPTFDEALAALDAPALRAMLSELARRQPELDALLESLLPGAREGAALAANAWSARVGALFRRAGAEVEAVPALADAVRAMVAEAEATMGAGDHLARATLHGEVARAVLGRIRRAGDGAAPLRAIVRDAVDAMARAARGLSGDPVARRAVLRGMVELLRFDIEHGTASQPGAPGRYAVSAAVAAADADDRAALTEFVRDRMERADDWSHRAWMGAYVELQEGNLDDASWLAMCREHQRFAPMARRLLALGRVDEALAAAAQLGDGVVLDVAGEFVARGAGERFESLVGQRVERASEANRARLAAWLRERAAARRDEAAALEVAERVFRGRPDRASWDALREAALAAGAWDAVEARAMAFLEACAQPLLASLLVERGALARAAEFVTGPRAMTPSFQGARAEVAAALEAARDPRGAAAVCRAQAEVLVAQRSRAHYGEACRAMARARTLLESVGEGATAADWIEALRAKGASRPALRQLLEMHFGDVVRAAG